MIQIGTSHPMGYRRERYVLVGVGRRRWIFLLKSWEADGNTRTQTRPEDR